MNRILLVILACFMIVGCSNKKTDEIKPEPTQEIVEETQEKIDVVEEEKGLIAEESEYLDVLKSALVGYSDSMEKIHKNFAKAEEDPFMFIDDVWRAETKEFFWHISISHDILKQLENDKLVPNGFDEIHSTVLESLSEMVLAGDIIFEGIDDSMNIKRINEGALTMQDSMNKMNETNELLQEKIKEIN